MDALSAYLPIDRHQALVQGQDLADWAEGAVLFADASGFTRLTAALAHELGPQRGAEEVSRQLDRIFTELIDRIHTYGGSVISFSGDAITCWFDEAVGAGAAQRAVTCGFELQQVMQQRSRVTTPGGTSVSLGVKVAVVAGSCRRFLVGSPEDQCSEVLGGELLDRMAAAEQQARRDEVVVGAEVVELLGEEARVLSWRTDTLSRPVAVLSGLSRRAAPAPWPELPELDAEQVRPWLLAPVYQRLQRGAGGFLAELRPAVVLFLQFTGIDYDRDLAAGAKLDTYVRWVQQALARYEGSLMHVIVGDKGSYLVITFGVPIAHEDDLERAAAVALEFLTLPPELDFIQSVRIGMSQGLVHAGAYGGVARRTYSVLGNDVNIAARLMGHARPGQILVAAGVAQSLDRSYELDSLGLTSLKGQPEPQLVFALRARRASQPFDPLRGRSLTSVVGRASERTVLAHKLQALIDGQGGTLLIEGEAGIGKSRLVADMIEQAHALGIPTLLGAGDAVEQATAYYAWRPIFRHIFGLDDISDPALACERVLSQLADAPALLERAPLLDTVLPLNMPDNDFTRQMVGEVRIRNTQELLVGALARVYRRDAAPLLILEDAHWLDSASWALALHVRQELPGVLLVIASRPLDESSALAAPSVASSEEYRRLLNAPGTKRLLLGLLSEEDTLALVSRRLGVGALPPAVAEFIFQRAEGHPFFSEELAYALRDAGLIQIAEGECVLGAQTGGLQDLDFPRTIQGVITSRIDRLGPAQQLTLKVASVIGRVFAFRTLRDIHPVAEDRIQLEDYMAALERLDITRDARQPDLAYIFKHIITQEVTYNLMAFAQRRELHRNVAEWYERSYPADLSPFYGLLAHHWTKAEAHDKAIIYLELAGEQAFHQYANREAIHFFGEAARLDALVRGEAQASAAPAGSGAVRAEQLRRARWLRQLGQAHVNLGMLAEGRPHLEEALRLLGAPLPVSGAQLAPRLLAALGRQLRHRVRGSAAGTACEVAQESARAYSVLSAIYIVSNDLPQAAFAMLAGLNYSEQAGPSGDMACAAANMAVMSKFAGAHGLGRRYAALAVETANRSKDLVSVAEALSRCSIYHASIGEWRRAECMLQISLSVAERLENRRQLKETLIVQNMANFYRARYGECLQGGQTIEQLAHVDEDSLYECWGLVCQARALLRLGDCARAIRQANRAQALIEQAGIVDPGHTIINEAVLSLAHLHTGQREEAGRHAQTALELLRKNPNALTGGSIASSLTAEALLALLEEARPAEASELGGQVRLVCKIMFGQVRTDPVTQPAVWLLWGRYCWLTDQRARARRAWRKSLTYADRYEMPFEAAQAHTALARYLLPGNLLALAERSQHRTRALAIFKQLGLPRAQADTPAPSEPEDVLV